MLSPPENGFNHKTDMKVLRQFLNLRPFSPGPYSQLGKAGF
jgi:hypothetical protein